MSSFAYSSAGRRGAAVPPATTGGSLVVGGAGGGGIPGFGELSRFSPTGAFPGPCPSGDAAGVPFLVPSFGGRAGPGGSGAAGAGLSLTATAFWNVALHANGLVMFTS